MSRRSKPKFKKEAVREHTLSLSIVVLSSGDPEGIDHFLGSVSKIKKPYEKDFEILISSPDHQAVNKKLQASAELQSYLEKDSIKVIEFSDDAASSPFVETISQASKDHVLVIEADSLEKSFNLDEFFYVKQDQISDNGIILASFLGQEESSEINNQGPVFFCRKDLVEYYSESGIGSDYQNDLSFLLDKLSIPKGVCRISQLSPLKTDTDKQKGFFQAFKDRQSRSFNWNIMIPIREQKTRPHLRYDFLPYTSLYRILFVAAAFILLFLLPLMSRQAGISGDDEKHYWHAEKVYNYYATDHEDQSALSDPQHKLNYYGQSFDLLTYVVNKILSPENPYEVRHALIALAGFLTMLVCGSMAVFLAGYRAGFITMVLMFFAPRFIGHSFNNPLDIPFALGYVFTIYQIFRFLKKLPHFSSRAALWITLGIAFTISIRIGGLMLIPYAIAFAGLYLLVTRWKFKLFSPEYLKFVWKGLVYLVIISLAGYLLSLLVWPYGIKKPFANPFEALRMMSNITVSIRVLFDGDIHWSNMLPWYYLLKNIMFTVPVIILLGFIANAFLYRISRKQYKAVYTFFLYFSVLFPVAYIIYKNSNVYGGWRHVLFVFPPMVVLASLSFDSLIRHFRSRYLKYAVAGLIFLGILHPARHIIANHPFEYMYFNEILGGTNAAYGRFETDYYLNSLKQGSEWLIENVIEELPPQESEKIRIATNARINYYFRNHRDKVSTHYTRYYDRGSHDWDYAVYFCNYISPDQLKSNLWPPYNTIHTIKVDSVPVCAIVKRKSKNDLQGIQLVDQKNYNEAIPILERVIREEPLNEMAMLKLSEACIAIQNYNRGIEVASQCLGIYPDYDKALNMIGIAYMNMGDLDKAITTFIRITRINYRFVTAYHNLGLAFARKNDYETAKNYFRKAIEVNSNFKPSYLALGEILTQQGFVDEGNRYLRIANSL